MTKSLNVLVASLFILSLGLVETVWAETATKKEISISFVGDIMLADLPGKEIKAGRDPFRFVAPILSKADVRVGNLECVVANKGIRVAGKPWVFLASPKVLPVLKRHIDVAALANNHSLDYGTGAFVDMIGHLQQTGIASFGGGKNLAEAHKPVIVEKNGFRIALLGYDEFFPRHFEADIDRPGVAWSEDEQVVFDIKKAKADPSVDFVIPMMHWGFEHEAIANSRQRFLARLMIDAGADAVIGGHPHVTQDVEEYKGKPIIYSLGNFVFDGFTDTDNNTGWVVTLVFDQDGPVRWQNNVIKIDKTGTPRPETAAAQLCWQRGQGMANCPASK
jgi:poly-gamma-glutamate capsule biosynthesis protein CapA/YwtB (metallophosphatase superfamily)